MLTLLQASLFLAAVEATAPTPGAPVSALHAVQLAAVSPEAEAALRHFSQDLKYDERIAAAQELQSYGDDAAFLVAELARSTANRNVLEDCYTFLLLHQGFAKHPATRELVVTQGLDSEVHSITYQCVWYAGHYRVVESREHLFRLMQDHQSDRNTRSIAAQSLGQLGDFRAFGSLLEACRSDHYARRLSGNIGLKGLTGKNLRDFGDYRLLEGDALGGALSPSPVTDPLDLVNWQMSRFTALRDYLLWLKQEHPDWYGIASPSSGTKSLDMFYK